MIATQTLHTTRVRLMHVLVAIALIMGAIFALRADIYSQPRKVTVEDLDITNMGAWERAYFLEGAQAPKLVGSGVNDTIAISAQINATVATGTDNGNRERLMFGIE